MSMVENRTSFADRVLVTVLAIVGLVMLFPFYYLVILSVMPFTNYMKSAVHLLPDGFTLEYINKLFTDPKILKAYGVSIYVTALGTGLNLVLTTMLAYVLSKRKLKHFVLLNFLVLVPMVFNGGLIPFYLVSKELHLLNTIWVYILPFGVNCFNVLLMKNFFMLMPDEIEESAKMDGAGDFTIFLKIILPLSKPVIATVGLFYATFHWNEWFWSSLFNTNQDLYPITVLLNNLLAKSKNVISGAVFVQAAPISLSSAIMLFIVVPVILVYTFLQRYFTKGLILGAVKG